ncbi:MAG: hypothetical protein WBG20_03475, partial [Candidatus Deferrimicrobiaceae bacterium]
MVDGILNYLWLVPALPLLGVIVNSAVALFAERPLLLAEAAHGDPSHGPSARGTSAPMVEGHGASSHGPSTRGTSAPMGEGHGASHAAPAYRKLVAFVGPAVVGASFVVSLLAVLALA